MPVHLSVSTRILLLVLLAIIALVVTITPTTIWILRQEAERQAAAQVERNINVAWEMLRSKGQPFRIADGALMAGEYQVSGRFDVVDRVKDMVGGTATVFQGDTRVSTNVMKSDGSRAIGTTLAQGPAHDSVLSRRTSYRGSADILGETYMTAYDPILSPQGEVLGILYVGVKQAEFQGAIAEAQNAVLLVTLGAGTLSCLIVLWLARRTIVNPLVDITHRLGRLADGDDSIDIPNLSRTDEIGRIGKTLAVFRDTIRARRHAEEQGVIMAAEAKAKAEEDQQRREAAIGDEVTRMVNAACAGDLTSRIDLTGKDGMIRSMCAAINQLTATVDAALTDIATALAALARGDLTQRIERDYGGVFDRVKTDANQTIDTLARIVGAINTASRQISGSAAEVAAGAHDLSQRSEQQAGALEETAASMEELAATVRQNAANAQSANQLAVDAHEVAGLGQQVTSDAVAAMIRIEESSRKIGDIVGMIDEIAFQTNLLALNAAVEAARAGDAGLGFAVVAQEVRHLAQRSSQASKEIKTLITESSAQVQAGAGLVNEAGHTLHDILTGVKRVADIVAEIAAASSEQAAGIDQVNAAVSQMDEMTQQNAALVEESAAAAQSLAQAAGGLERQMAFFTLKSTPARPSMTATPRPPR